MKKNNAMDQDRNQQPRRLRLQRETLVLLEDAALRQHARGGTGGGPDQHCRTGSSVPTDF